MPKDFGGKIFYTREEYEEEFGEKLPPPLTEAQQEAKRAAWDQWAASAPSYEGPQPEPGRKSAYRDDLIGTEFEGWTRDPATDTWTDAHGRPAYDANGQRIHYPEGADTPTSPAPEEPETDTDDGDGITFHI